MGRPCPVCGKGMFRKKQLREHIKRHHPWYYKEYIENYGASSKMATERKKKKRQSKSRVSKGR